MASLTLTLFSFFSLICVFAEAEEAITAVVQQLRILNEEVRQLRADIPRMEDKLAKDVQLSEASLRAEFSDTVLPHLVESKVRQILTDLFQQESLDNMVNSQMTSEIRNVKVKQRELNETLSQEINQRSTETTERIVNISKDFGNRIDTLEELTDQLMKTVNVTSEQVMVLEGGNSGEERKKDGCKVLEYLLEADIKTSERIELLEDQQSVLIEFQQNLTCILEQGSLLARSGVRSRLLITTFYESMTDSHVLTLQELELTSTPFLKINNIVSMTYDENNEQLIFSRAWPDGIFSIKLDGTGLTQLTSNVSSYGMTMDQGRQLIFMTTYNPDKTVRKMSTENNGTDLTLVVDLKTGNYPFGIAVDPKSEMAYMCNYDKLFSVDYEGTNLELLYEGDNILGVAFDLERKFLYFNNDEEIMRWSVSSNSSEVVANVVKGPANMRYYDNRVYTSNKEGRVYVYDVITGQVKLSASVKRSNICLIP